MARPTDPFDWLIQFANLQGRLDQHRQLQGSWALEYPQAVPGETTFYIVMAGTYCCEFLDGGRLDLHPGDLIPLPCGTPHLLRSDSPVQPHEPTVEHHGNIPLYQLNGPGKALDMFCGSYRYHAGITLFGALPGRLLARMGESTQQPLRAPIGLTRGEAEGIHSGARSIIDVPVTALLALALRAYLDHQLLGGGLFGLLGDVRLERALRAMSERPEHVRALEQSARQAATSRANFVRASSTPGGISPWDLLIRIRMEKARSLLRQTQKSLLDIAAEAGYWSKVAFFRNFHQAFGEPPGRLRHQVDSTRWKRYRHIPRRSAAMQCE